jgi:hypothetical protein
MTIGEAFVPGALPEPAKPCSPTPSTRPDDLNLIYIQPRKQKKPSIESFPTTTKVVVTIKPEAKPKVVRGGFREQCWMCCVRASLC